MLSLYMPRRHVEGGELWLHSFLTSALTKETAKLKAKIMKMTTLVGNRTIRASAMMFCYEIPNEFEW
jgi:hypothetical protein